MNISEFEQRLELLEKETSERSRHKNPQYYHVLKDTTWCRIVVALLKNTAPSEDDINYVLGIRSKQRCSTTLPEDVLNAVKDGSITKMNVMDILDKYRDTVPNLHSMLQNALKEAGYVCKGFHIVTEKEAITSFASV